MWQKHFLPTEFALQNFIKCIFLKIDIFLKKKKKKFTSSYIFKIVVFLQTAENPGSRTQNLIIILVSKIKTRYIMLKPICLLLIISCLWLSHQFDKISFFQTNILIFFLPFILNISLTSLSRTSSCGTDVSSLQNPVLVGVS